MLTIIQTTHPQWLGNNHWILPVALALFGTSAVLFLFQFRWVQKLTKLQPIPAEAEQPAKSEMGQSNQVGRDNNGRQQNIGSVENYHEAAQVPPPPPAPPPPAPQIVVVGAQQKRLRDEMGKFVLNATGNLGLLVYIDNPEIRADGSHAEKVRGAVAVLNFYSLDKKPLGKIERAFWLDRVESEIDIDPGHREAIVIGQFMDGVWLLFKNKRRSPPGRSPNWSHRKRVLESLSVPLNPDYLPLEPCTLVHLAVITADGYPQIKKQKYRICTNAKNSDFSIEDEA